MPAANVSATSSATKPSAGLAATGVIVTAVAAAPSGPPSRIALEVEDVARRRARRGGGRDRDRAQHERVVRRRRVHRRAAGAAAAVGLDVERRAGPRHRDPVVRAIELAGHGERRGHRGRPARPLASGEPAGGVGQDVGHRGRGIGRGAGVVAARDEHERDRGGDGLQHRLHVPPRAARRHTRSTRRRRARTVWAGPDGLDRRGGRE